MKEWLQGFHYSYHGKSYFIPPKSNEQLIDDTLLVFECSQDYRHGQVYFKQENHQIKIWVEITLLQWIKQEPIEIEDIYGKKHKISASTSLHNSIDLGNNQLLWFDVDINKMSLAQKNAIIFAHPEN